MDAREACDKDLRKQVAALTACVTQLTERAAEAPKSIICPISLEVMQDPVMDSLGYTYERENVERALATRPGTCVLTNERYPGDRTDLLPNRSVRDAVDEWKALRWKIVSKLLDRQIIKRLSYKQEKTGPSSSAKGPPAASSTPLVDTVESSEELSGLMREAAAPNNPTELKLRAAKALADLTLNATDQRVQELTAAGADAKMQGDATLCGIEFATPKGTHQKRIECSRRHRRNNRGRAAGRRRKKKPAKKMMLLMKSMPECGAASSFLGPAPAVVGAPSPCATDHQPVKDHQSATVGEKRSPQGEANGNAAKAPRMDVWETAPGGPLPPPAAASIWEAINRPQGAEKPKSEEASRPPGGGSKPGGGSTFGGASGVDTATGGVPRKDADVRDAFAISIWNTFQLQDDQEKQVGPAGDVTLVTKPGGGEVQERSHWSIGRRSHLPLGQGAPGRESEREAERRSSGEGEHPVRASEEEAVWAPWEIQPDEVLLKGRLGHGAFGAVHRGVWRDTDVAVKRMRAKELTEEDRRAFVREAAVLQRLRHPNVLLFLGAIVQGPQLAIVTELLPRGSLYRLLRHAQRNPAVLDLPRRARMMLDAARGMSYLHSCRPAIVHRDLKSPNLLVDRTWQVKVGDFGSSGVKRGGCTDACSLRGTPQWMAPEALRSEPSDEAGDVYSFGVILWETFTGQVPWKELNSIQVVAAVGFQQRRLEIPPSLAGSAVADLIARCCAPEPGARISFPQIVEELNALPARQQ